MREDEIQGLGEALKKLSESSAEMTERLEEVNGALNKLRNHLDNHE